MISSATTTTTRCATLTKASHRATPGTRSRRGAAATTRTKAQKFARLSTSSGDDDDRSPAPVAASVETSDGRLGLTASALSAFADGWFTGGRLVFTSGANLGFVVEVKRHASGGGQGALQRQAIPIPVEVDRGMPNVPPPPANPGGLPPGL